MLMLAARTSPAEPDYLGTVASLLRLSRWARLVVHRSKVI